MGILLGATFTASFFDSLNPSAIAQQMLLQAMVKNKRHIWFFIAGIGTANMALGLAVYYGIAAWASRLLFSTVRSYPIQMHGAALAAGIICAVVGIYLVVRTRLSQRRAVSDPESNKGGTISHINPVSLFVMGAAFCAVELTSAFPYFGFLAMLTGYQLVFPLVLLFILIYDFMYMLPLIFLYFGYNRMRGTKAIQKLETLLGKVSAYIVPAVIGLTGVLLTYYGAAF